MPNKRKAERDRSPLHIWLQWGAPSCERTWCEDKINDDDVVYIRGGASVSDLALENLALTARAEKAERERDEARARLAAAVEWAAANKPFGGNGTISNEIHASMAEGDRLDVILSDAPALAVVEGKVVANALTDNRREIIIYRAHSNGVFLVEPIPVTVVVLHANAVLERGVDHPTLSEG